MNKEYLSYIAGLIDGEGNVQVYCSKNNKKNPDWKLYYLRVRIEMTGNAVSELKTIHSLWGGSFSERQPKGNRRKIYSWAVFGSNALNFLKDIKPFIRMKKETVDNAIAFQEHMLHNSFRGHRMPQEVVDTRERFLQIHQSLSNQNR